MTIDVGAKAPDFRLKDQNNQIVRLADFAGQRPVLLVFYPLAFTGVCSGELRELQDTFADYAEQGVAVLTVSVDSVYSHKVFAMQEGYEFPMLADFWPHGDVARRYGVLNADAGFADRGTFLVDRDGIVKFAEHAGPGESRDQERWRKAVAALAD
ncbi:peroxiredoxin [Pilimelia columellifera]|uniref:Peroxiredoxin n=1 Tax=Pilimelia columellifera subsp. columellifera TaxID=706583 RepID=A0ABN3NHA4_9ACTN